MSSFSAAQDLSECGSWLRPSEDNIWPRQQSEASPLPLSVRLSARQLSLFRVLSWQVILTTPASSPARTPRTPTLSTLWWPPGTTTSPTSSRRTETCSPPSLVSLTSTTKRTSVWYISRSLVYQSEHWYWLIMPGQYNQRFSDRFGDYIQILLEGRQAERRWEIHIYLLPGSPAGLLPVPLPDADCLPDGPRAPPASVW